MNRSSLSLLAALLGAQPPREASMAEYAMGAPFVPLSDGPPLASTELRRLQEEVAKLNPENVDGVFLTVRMKPELPKERCTGCGDFHPGEPQFLFGAIGDHALILSMIGIGVDYLHPNKT